jgi:ribosome-associated translation inhibitor RaiA
MSAQGAAELQIRWTRSTGLRETARRRIESRLQRLAAGHRDLLHIQIDAHDTSHAGHQIKITCSTRGHAIAAVQEHSRVGSALHGVLGDFERQVHRLRARRRSDRRARAGRPELAPPDLEV